MVTLADLRRRLRAILKGIPDASYDSDCIVCTVCHKTYSQLLLGGTASDQYAQRCVDAAKRRAAGVPLQYLLGSWEFYGLTFAVGPGVLIPRADTETLVDAALKLMPDAQGRAVDLCSGTGCVAAAIAVHAPKLKLIAVENSKQALAYLSRNLAKHAPDAAVVAMDVLGKRSSERIGLVDMIVCNPPYLTQEDMMNLQREVRHEPPEALYGGEDGLIYYKTIPLLWRDCLRPGGTLLFEVGKGQHEQVARFLKASGYCELQMFSDAAGIIRVVGGRKANCLSTLEERVSWQKNQL